MKNAYVSKHNAFVLGIDIIAWNAISITPRTCELKIPFDVDRSLYHRKRGEKLPVNVCDLKKTFGYDTFEVHFPAQFPSAEQSPHFPVTNEIMLKCLWPICSKECHCTRFIMFFFALNTFGLKKHTRILTWQTMCVFWLRFQLGMSLSAQLPTS